MPQTSPINWILISLVTPTIISTILSSDLINSNNTSSVNTPPTTNSNNWAW